MSDKKGWGSTVLGWFIVNDESGESSSLSDSAVITEAAESSAEPAVTVAPSPVVFQKDPPAATGGKIDFDGVFDAAGIEGEERDRVRKAAELLHSLPGDTDPAVKKQIVEASLKAFGVPIDSIIETSVAEIEALEGYIRTGAADTQNLINESEKRIQLYEEEIRKIRNVMQERVTEQKSVIDGCNQKKLEIQQILEFFGQEAVARVVQSSAKLHDPATTV